MMSSMASRGSDSAAPIVSMPTGPPPNERAISPRYLRSITSSPAPSTSSSCSARSAIARVTVSASATIAKSRTRRSRRPAIRGVPRARRAISLAPSADIPSPRTRAPRATICSSSSIS
ncbi:hypothetical protein FOHLNKBM_6362 [Methylobacterium longum]|nr:hypothetical protein FOHLNKBM_6362 [Methylobacterium longum]